MRSYFSHIIIILLLLSSTSLHAQESQFYAEDNEQFKEAMFLLEQENYLAAQEVFEEVFDQNRMAPSELSYLVSMTSAYYSAYCSYKLELPDIEKRYLNFIKEYHDSNLRKKAYFDLGSYYFAKKKTSNAIKYYELVDTKDLSREELVTYKFNLGYAYFKKKAFVQAKPLFQQVKQSQNKYYEPANYYYGFINFYQENLVEAENSFELIKNSSLYEDVVPYYLTQIYFLNGDYQKVVSYATPLLAQNKIDNKDEISHIVGQAYFELGDFSKAAPLLQRYVDETKKVSKEELYQLSYAQYKNGDYTSAIDNLLELNIVDDALGQNAMYVLADSYLKTGDKSNAKDAFFQASTSNYDPFITENSLFQYAKLSLELGFTNKAIESLTEFLEQYKGSANESEAASLLSNALLNTKNYAKVIELIEQYNITGPDAAKTYQMVTLFRAIELYNDQTYPAALGLIDKSLQNPVDAKYHAGGLFLKGNLMFEIEKYDAAIINFNSSKQFNLSSNEGIEWASSSLANYYIAYSQFKKKDYSSASVYFNQAIPMLQGSNTVADRKLLQDSYLRNADCLFMTGDYPNAITNYDRIINNNWVGVEYALLQQSIIYGLQGNTAKKISVLKKLSSQYPNSSYAPLAAFELGNAHIENGNLSAAITQFNSFIAKYPDHPNVPEAHLKLGLSYFNIDNTNQSLASYKRVVMQYPNSEEAKEALIALKELYIYLGRPNDYFVFLENEAGISISSSAQDSIMFQVAEEKYLSGDCNGAITSLDEYITLFANGTFSLKAYYYRADCLFKGNLYNKAYLDYKKVLEKGSSSYYENSLVKATYIAYEIKKDYQEANFLYNELYQGAALTSNREIALIGLMRTYFRLNKQQDVLVYANEVLNDPAINQEVKVEATFYKAKALFATNKYNEARTYFETIVNEQPISKIKAESAYHLAKIQYLNGQFQQSLDASFAVKNEYASYEYWVVKTFILIADNYKELGNVFQAKATLQSILDNYNGDQALIDEAQMKLDLLLEAELKDSKLDLNGGGQDTIQFDNE